MAQHEMQHSAMMAMIGDQAVWYADTRLETELAALDEYYTQLQATAKTDYETALKDQYTKEQEMLQENYAIQERIALEWINDQKSLLNQQISDKREAARLEDYEQELADLQKQIRQTKSARERRELQERMDDMIRDEALRQEEAEAQQIMATWDQLSRAMSSGLIGLGDLSQALSLPDVAFGSGGLSSLTGIDAKYMQQVLDALSASTKITNTGPSNIVIDLRGAVLRSKDNIDAIQKAAYGAVVERREADMRSRNRD